MNEEGLDVGALAEPGPPWRQSFETTEPSSVSRGTKPKRIFLGYKALHQWFPAKAVQLATVEIHEGLQRKRRIVHPEQQLIAMNGAEGQNVG
jgi:hypothetical protein